MGVHLVHRGMRQGPRWKAKLPQGPCVRTHGRPFPFPPWKPLRTAPLPRGQLPEGSGTNLFRTSTHGLRQGAKSPGPALNRKSILRSLHTHYF